jgi:hypothetical protein
MDCAWSVNARQKDIEELTAEDGIMDPVDMQVPWASNSQQMLAIHASMELTVAKECLKRQSSGLPVVSKCSPSGYRGAYRYAFLTDLAKILGIERSGNAHQAGNRVAYRIVKVERNDRRSGYRMVSRYSPSQDQVAYRNVSIEANH